MYVAVLSVIVGQALLFGRRVLLIYDIVASACMWSFVHGYEQPALLRRFGDEYRNYRNAVPG
jgi:protein-S-isoprenylcysteine O-methyltransferase Ste14